MTSLLDAGLSIAEFVNGKGVAKGWVKIAFGGNEIRIDDMDETDVASLTAADFVFV